MEQFLKQNVELFLSQNELLRLNKPEFLSQGSSIKKKKKPSVTSVNYV